jgi:carbon-monoxide dehydrogenase medium subunit
MKPAAFEYVVADSVESAVATLGEASGDGKIIAGGQSLVPMLNFRLLRPSVLVDINQIPGLAGIEDRGDSIRVGALTRHVMLETSDIVAAHFPVLSEAMTFVAHLAIRNRGTIGGSLSHADPAAELPMMTMLLDARIGIASGAGRRVVAPADFFLGALTTDLGDDDLVTDIEFPKLPPSTGWGFEEVARRSGDFALACVAATISVADGLMGEVRIGMMGIGETAMRASDAEALLTGQPRLTDELINEAVASIRSVVEPNTDLHASSDYRRHLVGVLAQRALRTAWQRAGGEAP